MSGKKKTIIKIEITLLVFLAALTALTLALSADRAAAPSAELPDAGQGVTVTAAAHDMPPHVSAPDDDTPQPALPDAPEAVFPEISPPSQETPQDDRFITLNFEEHNIGLGDLILVNSGNYYEIPEDNKLVIVGEHKSRSYVLLDSGARLAERIMQPLNAMMDDFYAETGINNVLLNSTYRSLARQQSVFDDWARRVGTEEAGRIAADPGYSEHHTGLAFDLAVYSGNVVSTFRGTGKYAWIHENAYKYGFVLRYPEDKQEITETTYEPWHFRYIGVPHAYFMTSRGYAFEEYMEYLKCFEFSGGHMFGVYDGALYEVYYVSGTKIPVPEDEEYTVSGDNSGGFIVTVKLGGDTRGMAALPVNNKEVLDA